MNVYYGCRFFCPESRVLARTHRRTPGCASGASSRTRVLVGFGLDRPRHDVHEEFWLASFLPGYTMTYSSAVAYLYRLQKHGIKLGLATMTALMVRLGMPQTRYRTLHIAGTNGKGSTAAMAAAMLQAAGYRVGLYTSPHLVEFRERIRVNGEMIARIAGGTIDRTTSDPLPTGPVADLLRIYDGDGVSALCRFRGRRGSVGGWIGRKI